MSLVFLAFSSVTIVNLSQLPRHFSVVWIVHSRETTHVHVVGLQCFGLFAVVSEGGGVVRHDFIRERSNIDAGEAEALLESLDDEVIISPQPGE